MVTEPQRGQAASLVNHQFPWRDRAVRSRSNNRALLTAASNESSFSTRTALRPVSIAVSTKNGPKSDLARPGLGSGPYGTFSAITERLGSTTVPDLYCDGPSTKRFESKPTIYGEPPRASAQSRDRQNAPGGHGERPGQSRHPGLHNIPRRPPAVLQGLPADSRRLPQAADHRRAAIAAAGAGAISRPVRRA